MTAIASRQARLKTQTVKMIDNLWYFLHIITRAKKQKKDTGRPKNVDIRLWDCQLQGIQSKSNLQQFFLQVWKEMLSTKLLLIGSIKEFLSKKKYLRFFVSNLVSKKTNLFFL